MAAFFALPWLAAAAAAAPLAPVHMPTKAVAPAVASARIVSGAKVSLDASAEPDGHQRTAAEVILEDGRRHPAKLVEFQ